MNIPLYDLLDLLSKAYASLRKHKHASWTGPEISEYMRATTLGIAERFEAENVKRALASGETLLRIVLLAAFQIGYAHTPKHLTLRQQTARTAVEAALTYLDPQSVPAKLLKDALELMQDPRE